MSQLYIGLMSGTSMDGIDAALVDFSGGIRLLHACSVAIPDTIRQQTRDLNHSAQHDLQRSLILDRQWGELFAGAVKQLLNESGNSAQTIRAIGSHGQTVRHAPSGSHGYTLQIGDPNTIAELTGIDVVADFRRRDVAAGGQGAPLAPAFHQAVFASPDERRAIINIGGMANITQLHHTPVTGFDSGPGNVLLDSWIQQHKKEPFDHNGQWAASGTVIPALLQNMLQEPYFARPAPKSTGRELFDSQWLSHFLSGNEPPQDVQATLAELTARTITDALDSTTDVLYICGGGAFNPYLLQRLTALSGKPVFSTETLGIPPDWLEAMAFAWLAKQRIERKPGNLPSVTGAKGERILGAVYPA